MKNLVKNLVIGTPLESVARKITGTERIPFTSSSEYWEARYRNDGNSGSGSYGRLSEFKSEVLNDFIDSHGIESVIEFGCGDGHQLSLMRYPKYIGVDISPKAVAICRSQFAGDSSKTFMTMADYRNETSQLSLSLDVIFHLVEDDVFSSYMDTLFAAGEDYVGIFSSNHRNDETGSGHERHRVFTDWIEDHVDNFELVSHIPNAYPFDNNDPHNTSLADFYFYKKIPAS